MDSDTVFTSVKILIEMIKSLFRIGCLIGLVLLGFVSTGCEQKTSDYGHEVLLSVGDRVLTVSRFQ